MDIEIEEGEVLGPNYERRTDEEIKELALQLYRGDIFTSMQIRDNDMQLLGNIFMPLLFMNALSKKMLMLNRAFSFYAEMKDAGPRSINGYPGFFSMSYLDQEDSKRLIDKFDAIREAMDNV